MYVILLLIICAELAALTVLAAKNRLTRSQFFFIAGATALCCAALMVFPKFSKKSELEVAGEKDYMFMAAALINDGNAEKAAEALERVGDSGNGEYGINALRALVYNMSGKYQAAKLYLDEPKNELESELKTASENETEASAELKTKITDEVFGALNCSEQEKERLNAEMKIRFLGGEGESSEDVWFTIRTLIGQNLPSEAYEKALAAADSGSVSGAIVTAEMYTRGRSGTFSYDDSEFAAILDRATSAQVTASRARLKLDEEYDDLSDSEREEYAEAYDESMTEFNIALDNLSMEAIKRAVRLLENIDTNKQELTAVKLELAKLYYLCGEEEKGDACLSYVFGDEGSSSDKRLGTEAALLKKAYLDSVVTGSTGDFSAIFNDMMSALYMGVWPQENNPEFEQQVRSFLRKLTGGIRVNDVEAENYPQVEFLLAVKDRDRQLTPEELNVTEDGNPMEVSSIEKLDGAALNICYVLDISGSMQGQLFESAVDAISSNVSNLDDNVMAGLVTFSNSAKVEAKLSSKYRVESTAKGIKCSEGGTNIPSGLSKAADVLSNAYGERIVFLLSDGYDMYSENLPAALAKLEKEGAVVYVIGIGGCDSEYLKDIANKTDGTFIYVSDVAQLSEIYDELSGYLANIFRIAYTVPGAEADGISRHVLRVSVDNTSMETGKIYSEEQTQQSESLGMLSGYAGLFEQVKEG